MSRQSPENPVKKMLMEKELDENNLMPLSADMLFLITSFLDLTSLRNLIGTSVQTYQVLNEGSPLWKSILKSLGEMPENGKEGKEYKARVKLFVENPYHQFFVDKLKIKEGITFEESKALHIAIVDACNALKKFSSDPQHFFRAFYKFNRTFHLTAGPEISLEEKCDFMKKLANRYGKVELELTEKVKLQLKYALIFLGLVKMHYEQGSPEMYYFVCNVFTQPLSIFVENFTVGDYHQVPRYRYVDQSDPAWQHAKLAVHEAVGSVLDSLDPNEDDAELKKAREFYEDFNQQLQNSRPKIGCIIC